MSITPIIKWVWGFIAPFVDSPIQKAAYTLGAGMLTFGDYATQFTAIIITVMTTAVGLWVKVTQEKRASEEMRRTQKRLDEIHEIEKEERKSKLDREEEIHDKEIKNEGE